MAQKKKLTAPYTIPASSAPKRFTLPPGHSAYVTALDGRLPFELADKWAKSIESARESGILAGIRKVGEEQRQLAAHPPAAEQQSINIFGILAGYPLPEQNKIIALLLKRIHSDRGQHLEALNQEFHLVQDKRSEMLAAGSGLIKICQGGYTDLSID